MIKKKPPEVRREIQNPSGYPVGTVIEEFMDGSITKHNPDGTKEFIDAQGKAMTKLTITETQIEAWNKLPKEQATKQILELINNNELAVTDKRFILDAIWKLAELHGATQPALPQGMQMLSVHVNIAQPPVKIKDVVGGVIAE